MAHLYLSGSGDEDLLIGNFIADSVPGRQLEQYPAGIQRGIRLHRAIDTFTDQHPVVRQSTLRLREAGYGKYAGVVSDVFFDHFLARNFHEFSEQPLSKFTADVYRLLAARATEFPARVQHFLPYMTRQDWLGHYADLEGIRQSLGGLSRRASAGSGMETAVRELERNYPAYEADFRAFFPELRAYVAGWQDGR
nr:acyl carrier protein phosphodiesterase [Hymenobacter translucens]